MIFGEDKHKKFLERRPHTHRTFSQGSHFSRRQFFEVVGAGVTASYLVGNVEADEVKTVQAVTQNKAATRQRPRWKSSNAMRIASSWM